MNNTDSFFAGIDPNKYYPRKDTAALLNNKPQTLAVWHLTGRENLPVTKIGRHCKYLGQDIIAYLKSKRSGGECYD